MTRESRASESGGSTPVRRPPPDFRRVSVSAVADIAPRMRRVTLTGPELDGFVVDEPAASVRLLIPSAGSDSLVIPEWNGNEFLLPDGTRPIIRTFTPFAGEALDLEVVVHDGGAVSEWVRAAGVGEMAAVSGPGRGYAVDGSATGFVLAGDETALPAIAQLVERFPPDVPVGVVAEVSSAGFVRELPSHPRLDVVWLERSSDDDPGDAMVAALEQMPLDDGTRVWAAGEAAVMQRVRKVLFERRGVDRKRATVRGYWKRRR